MKDYMRNFKKAILIICCFILALAIIVGYFFIKKKVEGERIFNQVNNYLKDYPSLPTPYTYSEFYVTDGEYKYLVLQNSENVVVGKQLLNSETIYYIDDMALIFDENETLVESYQDLSPLDSVKSIVAQYANNPNVTYTCEIEYDLPVPFWVSTGEYYLICYRAGQEDIHEVMASTFDDNYSCLRWYMLGNNSDKKVLFLHVCKENANHGNFCSSLELWGNIPDQIENMILQEKQH